MRLELFHGPKGKIALPEREADAATLEAGPVWWQALPGVGIVAHLETPAWLAGTLAATSFAEVSQLIGSTLKTGVLHLALASGEARQRKAIHFRDGQVVFASSSDPRDRLGAVLERTGVIASEVLARCTSLVKPGRPLGQVLVDEGVITAGQLYDGIAAQVREIFLSAFEVVEGEFLFREEPLDDRSAVRLPERLRDLLLLGLKRADAAEHGLPPPAAPPAMTPPPVPVARVVPVPAPVPAGAAAAAPPAATSGPFTAYQKLFRAIFAAVSRSAPEGTRRLDSWFERLPAARRAAFQGVRFGPGGELDVARVLANVEAGGGGAAAGAKQGAAARARALESLEALLNFALFEAKNILPPAQGDALRRELHRIQMGG